MECLNKDLCMEESRHFCTSGVGTFRPLLSLNFSILRCVHGCRTHINTFKKMVDLDCRYVNGFRIKFFKIAIPLIN